MTKDKIIALAKEAGIDFEPGQALNGQVLDFTDGSQSLDRMTCFADLVAAKERAACALHIQSCRPPVADTGRRIEIGLSARMAYARAIRERGAA